MNDSSKISLREFLMLLSLGLMPPLMKLVPAAPVQQAGRAGWLAPLAAWLPVAGGIWLIAALGRTLPEEYGLGEALCRWLGRGPGRVLCLVYGVLLLLFASIALRFCAERFTSTIYPETGLGLFFGVILALEWYLGRRKLAVTARAGQLFFYVMLGTLALVLVMGLGSVRSFNIAPLWIDDLPALTRTTPPLLGGMSIGVGWLFLFGEVTERKNGLRRAIGWGSAMLLVLTVLGFVVTGVFGPALVMRLQIPFFSLSKELQIGSVVQRVEPLVVTMWVFADVISLALMLRGAERAFCCGLGMTLPLNLPLLVLTVPGAYLCADSFFALDRLYQRVFVPLELIFFLGVPLFAAVIGKVRD